MNKLKRYYKRVGSQARRVALELRHRKWLYLFVLLMTGLYASCSILRHWHFISAAGDLGIFDQVIWHYSRFETPYTTIRTNQLTEHILGDHFHPILITLAPIYWFTHGPEALLIAHAFLFALSIIPVYLYAEKRLPMLAVWPFVISYAIFWGIQTGVDFEFHEIAFAVPLIAFAIYFIDEKKRVGYFVCIGLLLLTKENLSVLVAFFGIYLIMLRQYRDGLISITLGITWFFAATRVFIPYFSGQKYKYWNYSQIGPTPFSAFKTMILAPWRVIQVAVTPAIKVQTMWHIFFPFLLLSFLSPLLVLTIPLLAERFLSDTGSFWEMRYHYTATISPVVAMAAIDGLSRIARVIRSPRVRRLSVCLAALTVLILNLYLLPSFPLWRPMTNPVYWTFAEGENLGDLINAAIPPNASVATQNFIVPHFSERQHIFLLTPLRPIPDADYIVASKFFNPYPYDSFDQIEEYLALQQSKGYIKLEFGGWIVLSRPGAEPLKLP